MIIKTAHVTLTTVTPLSQGRFHNTEKKPKELHDAYEKRTWRNRLHVTDDGYVLIPKMAFKNCMAEAAKYLSIKVPGQKSATYTKHFESGVMVLNDIVLPVKAENVEPKEMFVPSDGRRGGGKRVLKYFPWIKQGVQMDVEFTIVDEIITEDVFTHVLQSAGLLIGIGTFRVRNNGECGRFRVDSVKWNEQDMAFAANK